MIFLALSAGGPLFGQSTQTWNTNSAGSNWSGPSNWNPSGNPAGNDLIFGDAFGETANATTVGNIVDQDYTVNSLTYNNTGTSGNFWQVTEISSTKTLTLNAAGVAPATIFTVGGVSSASTRVAIRGAGTFTIDEASAAISVGTPTGNQSALLDMSGLSTFNATVATANFGSGQGNGDVTLANSNAITATTLNLGTSTGSTGSTTKSDLLLGTVNTIHADTINVGLNYGSGNLAFRTGLTNPSVTIRGTAGGASLADLTVGNSNGISINNSQGSSVNLRGGSVDAALDQVLIGRRADTNANAGYYGSFAMDQGSVTANAVVLGQTAGTGNASALVTSTLAVEGGTFAAGTLSMADNTAGATSVVSNLNVSGSSTVVTVSGNVTAGSRSGTASTVAANVTVSAGTLLIQGNLAEGAGPAGVTSTVTLSGTGTLNMDHGNIAVDTFTMTGGTLKDVANFAASTSGGLNLQSASKLAFGIDSGFTTLGLTGTLTLGASSDLVLSLANGFTPGSSFTLVANDLADAISGSFATINGSAFGPGNSFSLTNDMGTFNYTLSYTGGTGNDLMAIPEPSACLLLAGAGAIFVVMRRRHRK